jgi:hypothetical protein
MKCIIDGSEVGGHTLEWEMTLQRRLVSAARSNMKMSLAHVNH